MTDPRVTQLIATARDLIAREAWPQVLQVFDRVVELAPTEASAHYNRASVLHHLGRLEEAEAALARALELKPVYPVAQQLLNKVTVQLATRPSSEEPVFMPPALEPDEEGPALPVVYELGSSAPPPPVPPPPLPPAGLPPAPEPDSIAAVTPARTDAPGPFAETPPAWPPAREEADQPREAYPLASQPAAVAPALTADAIYPWETLPEVLAQAEAYDADGQFRSVACHCREMLSGLPKPEATEEALEAELRIYPDLVGVNLRPQQPGCLTKLLDLPPPWGRLLYSVAVAFATLLALPFMGVGCLVALPGVLLGLLFSICAVILAPLMLLIERFQAARLARIAARLRSAPLSPWAIKKLFQMKALIPRYWRKGEVVQIVRLDARKRLKIHALVLLVQDRPLPNHPGCVNSGVGLMLERFFSPQRRVYLLRVDGGPEKADEAAAMAAEVLGVPVSRGQFALLFGALNIN